MKAETKSSTVTFRLKPELRERLDRAISRLTYKPSITVVMERGLELALQELEYKSHDT